MFPKFADAFAAIQRLKERGIFEDYAVFGAVAHLLWDEAISTFDLDILILLPPQTGPIVSLSPIYEWARENGYPEEREHIYVGEVPIQFVVAAPNSLEEEAVKNAATLDFEGLPIRVATREYLIATWLKPEAKTPTRRDRARRLSESPQIDQALLSDLMSRFGLSW